MKRGLHKMPRILLPSHNIERVSSVAYNPAIYDQKSEKFFLTLTPWPPHAVFDNQAEATC
jgi:hypothetical protein